MVMELLWIELLLKAVVGLVLATVPRTFGRIAGLGPLPDTFWPRLLGATLLGLAAATFLEGQTQAKNGLGLSGHVAINLAAVLALISLLIMGRAAPTKRGRILVGLAAAALTVLALVELAYA